MVIRVTGNDGYVRWTLDGAPIFEIPASTITDPPQGTGSGSSYNPKKIMIEEPSYFIFNVAMSSAWGTSNFCCWERRLARSSLD